MSNIILTNNYTRCTWLYIIYNICKIKDIWILVDLFIFEFSYQLSDLDQKLGDWNIPKVPTNQVYRSSSWQSKISFRTDYHVRTIEQVYSINKEYETCYLLSPAAMMAHRKDGQKFLHIGLVQVGVKPLIREGLYIYKSGLKYHIGQLVSEFSVYKPR